MTDNIGWLASFLDMNKDGSMVDDVAGFVGKLFGLRTAESRGTAIWRIFLNLRAKRRNLATA